MAEAPVVVFVRLAIRHTGQRQRMFNYAGVESWPYFGTTVVFPLHATERQRQMGMLVAQLHVFCPAGTLLGASLLNW